MLLPTLFKVMLRRRFRRIRYAFIDRPVFSFTGPYGIYIHIPFCHARCTFCPFYKELYQQELARRYVDALVKEIEGSLVSGRPDFIYIGGGTPNTLGIEEIGMIVAALRKKVAIPSMGIELSPTPLTAEYIEQLAGLGFSKISIGVQSFARQATDAVGRSRSLFEHIRACVSHAQSLGLYVNVDLLLGLARQTRAMVQHDTELLMQVRPRQISLYPLITPRGHVVPFTPGLSDDEQRTLIEEQARLLSRHGYRRTTVWVFADDDGDLYDTSGSEIGVDYRGFGAGAYSVCGGTKTMNPDLYSYLFGIARGSPCAFVAHGSRPRDDMRQFSRGMYNQRIAADGCRSGPLRALARLLELCGYVRDGRLTAKGQVLAHTVSTAVMTELPFPLMCPESIVNEAAYWGYQTMAINAVSISG